MKIKTNGIELNYVVEGNGPWLVMSHSLACDLTMWDEQAAVLRRNFKVLRFDTRGHGASDARRRVHARHDGLRRARPLAGAWRRALPLGRPVDGRDDRPDLRAEISRDVREHGARRHHQPLRARGAAAVAGP